MTELKRGGGTRRASGSAYEVAVVLATAFATETAFVA